MTARTWGRVTGAGARKAKEERLARQAARTPEPAPEPPAVAYHRTRPRSPDRPPPRVDRHREDARITVRLPSLELRDALLARAERLRTSPSALVIQLIERELYGTQGREQA